MGRAEADWPNAVTIVIAAATPRQRRWAVATALEIARRLAERHKVVVADVQVHAPYSVAEALDLAAASRGMVDVLFRGASFAAVACRPASEAFFFLPLGSAPPPLSVLYHHPRWKKIAARLAEADAHMLPCVSADQWLEAGPIAGFEWCIVLNASGAEVELPEGARQVAEFLAPPEIRAPDAEPVPAPASPIGPPSEREPPAREAAHKVVLMNGLTAAPGRAPARKAATVARLLAGPRRRSVVPAAALAVAALLVFAVWSAVGTRRGPESAVGLEAAADTTVGAAPETAAGAGVVTATRRVDTNLAYSVAIASYSSYEDALRRQREWTRPELPVYIAPTPVRGVLYYRVYAGMLPERRQAEDLMARLVEAGMKDTVRAWDVRPARYAFSFGTYGTRRDARAVVESLLGQGVPAYVVPAAADRGDAPAYRVYAGGYERPEEAGPLGELIERAGLSAELVERVGLPLP